LAAAKQPLITECTRPKPARRILQSCPTLSLGFSRFASTKQLFVTSGSRPQAVLSDVLENLVTGTYEWQVFGEKSEPPLARHGQKLPLEAQAEASTGLCTP